MAKQRKYDQWLFLAVVGVLIIGVIMLASIGVPKSIRLSAPDLAYPDCGDAAVDCYLILKNHVMRVLIGVGAMLLAFKINYRFWKKMALPIFIMAVVLLGLVLFAGDDNNTFARSWFNIPFLPFINSVQPSEVAKLGLIMYLAFFFSQKISFEDLQVWSEGPIKFAIIAGLAIGPIILQPDYGSGLVLSAIAVTIYFLAGANWKHLALGALMVAVASVGVISSKEYIQNRVDAFLSPDIECAEDYCWQTRQANIAIGSGGFWGKGLTQGVSDSFWLPQASDDFIFAASAEELGFVRCMALVLMYAFIAFRGFQITNHAPNQFAMLLAAGVSTWISAQAFLNIMVNIALFPITGVTLPFMSYGGSSMVTTLFAVGILLNISKYTTTYAYSPDRRRNSGPRRSKSSYRRRYSR
jgi:cell division protein FtsW